MLSICAPVHFHSLFHFIIYSSSFLFVLRSSSKIIPLVYFCSCLLDSLLPHSTFCPLVFQFTSTPSFTLQFTPPHFSVLRGQVRSFYSFTCVLFILLSFASFHILSTCTSVHVKTHSTPLVLVLKSSTSHSTHLCSVYFTLFYLTPHPPIYVLPFIPLFPSRYKSLHSTSSYASGHSTFFPPLILPLIPLSFLFPICIRSLHFFFHLISFHPSLLAPFTFSYFPSQSLSILLPLL